MIRNNSNNVVNFICDGQLGRGRFGTGDKLWSLGAVAITTTELCLTKSKVLCKFNCSLRVGDSWC